METWEDIRMALDLALRGAALAAVGIFGYAVTLMVPIVRQWLAEKITFSAVSRLEGAIRAKAADIADPRIPVISTMAAAQEIAANKPQAMANSGSTVEGLANAIQDEVKRIKGGL